MVRVLKVVALILCMSPLVIMIYEEIRVERIINAQ